MSWRKLLETRRPSQLLLGYFGDCRTVFIGTRQLDRPMTQREALRYARSCMTPEMVEAGMSPEVFASEDGLHSSRFFRINYLKSQDRS